MQKRMNLYNLLTILPLPGTLPGIHLQPAQHVFTEILYAYIKNPESTLW
jgi:hypothetical protein